MGKKEDKKLLENDLHALKHLPAQPATKTTDRHVPLVILIVS
jgi:hypothetical protein